MVAVKENITGIIADIDPGVAIILIENTIDIESPYQNNDIDPPSNLSIKWIDDYARITFDNNSVGAKHQIFESVNGGNYSLVTTTDAGVAIYNYNAWQNARINFKIRAVTDNVSSGFSEVINIITPLVFKTDQSTLTTLEFQKLRMSAGYSIDIDWGDGTSELNYDVTSNLGITKNYTTKNNPYYVKISGDVDQIYRIDLFSQSHLYGDLAKWKLPADIYVFHFYGNNFSGDITNWEIPSGIGIFHIGNNNFSGDITNWGSAFPETLYDFQVGNNSQLTGDLSNWVFPDILGHITLTNCDFYGGLSEWVFPSICQQGGSLKAAGNRFSGDISGWSFPDKFTHIQLSLANYSNTNTFTGDLSEWVFGSDVVSTNGFKISCPDFAFTGDLSSALIPDAPDVINDMEINFRNNNLTKMPRGSFRRVGLFNFHDNNCSDAEINAMLVYIDDYFTGDIVPLTDCEYVFDGAGMGVADATGLAAKTSIESKYTAVGKTATIYVNS